MKSTKSTQSKKRTNKKDKKLSDRVVHYILSRKTREMSTLNENSIAAAIGVTPAEMLTVFQDEQDITLERFLVREKVHRAIFILDENEEIPITAISETLGFKEIDQFNREFEDYIFVPPLRYRELHKNKNA